MTEPARIIVIDDDENVSKALEMTLRANGYTVDTARDGKEAIKKSNSNFYNLALVDIRLPDMEGTALLTAMTDTTPKMIKIIITGYPSLENAIEAVNKNADGYIVKPFKTEELLSMIEEHLMKQREARRYSEQKVAEYIETRAKEQESEQ
jgi:DNA-binding NtrC family response regulator